MNLRDQFGHFVKRGESSGGPEEPDGEVAAADSSARLQLQHAIDAASAHEAKIEALRASESRLWDETRAADRQVEAARENEVAERSERVNRLVAGDTAALVRVNPSAIADAQEKAAACAEARALVKAALKDAEQHREWIERDVPRAAGRVIASEALPALLADVSRLHREWEGKQAVLMFLRTRVDHETSRAIDAALAAPEAVRGEHPAVEAWRQAWESLLTAPEAVLPGGPGDG